ncbi:MAG: helix-turn-helix transcriptional regulator [Acidobacteria bacterium]|nr:helix-turn-helix transcriptional regulator [Acidobacteriota bacterium]
MKRENLKARLLRAVSGKTQEQLGEEIGVHPGLIGQIEQGRVLARPDYLERLAANAGITAADAEELLCHYEMLRVARRRHGRSAEDVLEGLVEDLRSHARASYQRLETLPLPASAPRAEDRVRAAELFERLAELSPEERRTVVRLEEELQTWALCERVCHASAREASRDVELATAWAGLASEIAELVRGPEGFPLRVQGYSGGHGANVLRVLGELKTADVAFSAAKRLWLSGSDPLDLLDQGRMLDLEASLRRDQRRFAEALALLDEALVVGRSPERALIKKGFTLEVMGEYERAIETLVRAEPLVERAGDPCLTYMLPFNLAVNYTHIRRYDEAAELARRVGDLVAVQGDKIAALRVIWLRGRIEAGLGHRLEARSLLEEARLDFNRRGMAADAALALLEEAALLLDEGRRSEVKALAGELTKVLDSKGVHREALAALRLFKETAVREEATAELARRVLGYLFRARHDQGLRFES